MDESVSLPSLSDFTEICSLGKGAFARVTLVRKNSNGNKYAIKTMSKAHLLRKNMNKQIIAERNILALSNCPYIVPLYYSLETEDEVHLVLEFMHGRDFSRLLQKLGFFCEQTAVFYISEAAIAIDYLHRHDIIHRDIKLANFLMSASGHLKLSDFGLVQVGEFRQPTLSDFKLSQYENAFLSPKTKKNFNNKLLRTPGQILSLTSSFLNNFQTSVDSESSNFCKVLPEVNLSHSCEFCQKSTSRNLRDSNKRNKVYGTPDYLAPEVLSAQEYNYKIDWWALGICFYEMVVGFPPFNDATPEKIFDNIQKLNISFPSDDEALSVNLVDSILSLLNPDVIKRSTLSDLKNQPIFSDIVWESLYKLEAPIIPSTFDCPFSIQ